jgi:hypothetical protein
MNGQPHSLARFTTGEIALCIHWHGSRTGLRAGLKEEKILTPARDL